eukprot:8143078-Alexandrium_andersonii.AAC.1
MVLHPHHFVRRSRISRRKRGWEGARGPERARSRTLNPQSSATRLNSEFEQLRVQGGARFGRFGIRRVRFRRSI